MANPNLSTHAPIIVVQTVSGNQEWIKQTSEAASQTFLAGTPVQLNGSGNTKNWDGSTITRGIAGVSLLQGLNLATAGAGAPPLFGPVGFPGGTPTLGSVPNQASAVNLVHGAMFTLGSTLYAVAQQDAIFEAQVDASSGSTFAATTSLIGTQLGLTVDANGTWYVDLAKNTVGTNTVLTVVSLNPLDLSGTSITTQVNNGRVRFRFLPGVQQL